MKKATTTPKTSKVQATKVVAKAEVKPEAKKPELKLAKPAAQPKKEVPKKETSKEVQQKKPVVQQKPESLKTEQVVKPTEVKATETKAIEAKTVPEIFVGGKKLSAGAQVREMFNKALADGKIKQAQMNMLTDAEKTKETLKIRYSFLKLATENQDDRKVNGCPRYGKQTVKVNGKFYWVTNDVYAKQLPIFKAWVESL